MIPPLAAASGPIAVVDLASPDPSATARAHDALLGRPEAASPGDGWAAGLGNIAIRTTPGDAAEGGVHRVSFVVDDLDAARRLLGRRAHDPDTSPIGVTAPPVEPTTTTPVVTAPDLTGMDHLVFTCDDRDRAVALFGATFDLDFRLDQPVGGEARQLFFRAGSLIVEVVTPAAPPAPPVELWGVAWRSADVDATHARLAAAGFDLSEIRTGRKRGTRIFTVRERALATRSVVVGPGS